MSDETQYEELEHEEAQANAYPEDAAHEDTPISVTSDMSVDYPGPDDLRGHVQPEHDGETTVCPVCAHEFVPGTPRP